MSGIRFLALGLWLGLLPRGWTSDAVTNDTVEIPLVDLRIEPCQPFNPAAPEVNVVYTNLSANYAIRVPTPEPLDSQPYLDVWFDGILAHYLFDPDKEPSMFVDSVLVEPLSSLPVRYRLSSEVTVPATWGTVTVHTSHYQLLVDRDFSFDRSGRLLGVTVRRQRDLARLRAEILGSKPARRGRLEFLYRPSGAASNRPAPPVIQEPVERERSRPPEGGIETATNTRTMPLPTPAASADAAAESSDQVPGKAGTTSQAVEPAPGTETNGVVEIPLLDASIRVHVPFDAHDPVVEMIYTNLSKTHGIRVQTPFGELERRFVTLGVKFDGKMPRYYEEDADDVIMYQSAIVEPCSTLTVPYRLSDCYAIPTNWAVMTVQTHHLQLVAAREYDFDAEGKPLGVRTLQELNVAKLRVNVLSSPFAKRAILDSLQRSGTLTTEAGAKCIPVGETNVPGGPATTRVGQAREGSGTRMANGTAGGTLPRGAGRDEIGRRFVGRLVVASVFGVLAVAAVGRLLWRRQRRDRSAR